MPPSSLSWDESQMPSQHGRLVIVTGANTGLGFATSLGFARAGAHVILACRNEARGLEAQKRINDHVQVDKSTEDAATGEAEYMQLDIGALHGVRDFALAFKTRFRGRRLDILVLNAGVKAVEYSETVDGFEQQFGVNHLGPKLANLLFAYELHRRLERAGISPKQVLSVVCHPGVTESNLLPNLASTYKSVIVKAFIGLVHWLPWAQTNAQGALSILCCATDPNVGGGEFIGPHGLSEFYGWPRTVTSSKHSMSLDDAHELWEKSENLTGITFSLGI